MFWQVCSFLCLFFMRPSGLLKFVMESFFFILFSVKYFCTKLTLILGYGDKAMFVFEQRTAFWRFFVVLCGSL